MCRIYGYFNAVASPNEMKRVGALQRHGGPDRTGSSRASGWGLGSNRLAVIDLDGGMQPYEIEGRIYAVFNGEIYNHDALRERLRKLGHTFADRCDGGIIPALYEEYGEEFTDHLDGMYAIALLDLRDRPKLLLVTDHMGMKPLYYRWDPADRSLRFSSEIPALLGFEGVGTDVWEPGLDAYLASKTPFGEQTMFQEIKVLPAATTLRVTLGGAPELLHRPHVPVPAPDDADKAAELVRDALRTEVGRLLVADVPVAVITSGGLDSSLVTALAAEHGPVHSFNIAYRGTWPFEERHFARQAAEHADAVYHQVELDPATLPDLVEDVVWHLGQPNADPITVSTYALFAAVREAGFKVALTGDAADEVFGGYARMRAAHETAPAGPWYGRYLDALAVVPADRRRSLYTDDYRLLVQDVPPVPSAALDRLRQGEGTVLERITDFELAHRLPAYHLRRVDHLSMAHSVESRLPFCQPGVTSLGRALPDRLRIDGGKVKRTLYGAAAGLVPDTVHQRVKQPFTLPITAMLAPGSALWEMARDTLATSRLRPVGRLSPDAVDALFRTQELRPDDTTALTIWALMTYEVWQDQFQRSTGPVGVGAAA
ncbi:asparagine synthase (glutamine-hydrolyzing) [Streptomyces olivaceus]|uniref:asparagine synthase (glutamine-hydrolyzing) n=1 Tax=Streptomyces olivaceus TaxID=47716 RepID=UPI001CCFB371|nr:asparagine synthase (glutamine-hydrolyzing) [Streptomyces olivaceus]MBZ6295919.1 asparagine synthase (glutamine-hydrolyzing) [Streptomyces olivaceus]MBZ6330897.1 asparagine synthase (glutamine-hydrolyzing) [Streptomyces olivaceus]